MSVSEPQRITSRDNALLKDLRRLAQGNGEYRKQGRVWIEGDHLCSAALLRGWRPALAVFSESYWPLAPAHIAQAATKNVVIDDALMKTISDLPSPAPMAFLLDLPAAPTLDVQAPTVVLDRVQDAGNVGSMLRSAAAFGFTQIAALKGTAALWSAKVLRAGMGAHFAVALHTDAELTRVLAEFNGPAIVTSLDATQSLYALDLRQPCAFVFGNEGAGVSAPVLARASHPVRIPMPGVAESLNVAAAVAVCLFEQVRQRLPD